MQAVRRPSGMRPPSHRQLARNLMKQAGYAGLLVAASLILGMAGFVWIADLSVVDAFENAAMLLGGMGPVGEVQGDAGKIFSGAFALYAGLVFLLVSALVLTPVLHFVLHRFHWEADQE